MALRQDGLGSIQTDLHIRLAERRWSIRDLSRASGIEYNICRNYVNDTVKRLDKSVLARLCAALECQPGQLYHYTPTKKQDV